MLRHSSLSLLLAFVAAPALGAQWTVEGRMEYRDRRYSTQPPYTWTGVYTNRPIRRALVQIVPEDGTEVFASGATFDDGSFRLVGSLPLGSTCRVVCSPQVAPGVFGTHSLQVASPGPLQYSLASDTFLVDDTSGFLDLGHVLATAVQIEIVGAPPGQEFVEGNPFNAYDQLLDSLLYVKSLEAADPGKNLTILWPSSPTLVEGSATQATVHLSHAYGDDDPLILHELGHAVQMTYASFLTFGDIHQINNADAPNPYQAMTEAWATYFMGVVQRFRGDENPGLYLELAANASAGQPFRLEDAYPYTSEVIGGEASEGAIACALWDIADDLDTNDLWPGDDDLVNGLTSFAGGKSGEKVLWDATVGPFSSAPIVVRTIEGLWNGLYMPVNQGQFRAVRLALDAQAIRFYKDANEPNDTAETATPLALEVWSGIRTIYTTNNVPGVPGAPLPIPDGGGGPDDGGDAGEPDGGFGGALLAEAPDHDFYSFTLAAGQVVEVETRYPDGAAHARTYCDPYLVVRAPEGTVVPGGEANSGGVGRNAKVTFTAAVAGTYTAEVRANDTGGRRLGSYEVRVHVLP